MAFEASGASQRPLRWAVIGAVLAGSIGAVSGLVVGLLVNPPTAWFAVFELGVPASLAGCIVGLACGALACAIRRSTASQR
jgi:hypothetical protein